MNKSNNNTQNESNFPPIDFNSEVINEKKTKGSLKNYEKIFLNNLVNNHNGILAQCDEKTKNINVFDLEIDKLKIQLNSLNFTEFDKNNKSNTNTLKLTTLSSALFIDSDNIIRQDKFIKNLHSFDAEKDLVNEYEIKNSKNEETKKLDSNFILLENQNKKNN